MNSLMEFTEPKYSRFRRILDLLSPFRLAVFLLLCLIFGGTSQDIVEPKLILYILSLLIIGLCLTIKNSKDTLYKLKPLLIILGLFLLGHIIYIIPLPSGIWSKLPGRQFIVDGYQILGADLPWLPISISPEKSLFSLFDFLPPIALLLMIGNGVTFKEIEYTIRTIGFFAIGSVILGVLQVTNVSDFYLYEITNRGSAVGFFSNANHFGLFLLMSIPLVISLPSFLVDVHYDYSRRAFVFGIVCAVSALLGIGLTGSLGGFLLIVPVLVATTFIWKSGEGRTSIYLISILASLVAAFLFDMFIWENLQSEALDKISSTHATDRQTMFVNTFNMSKDFLPLGTGPGSFPDMYKLVETATRKTVPHAHNDYIEMFLEFGIFSIIWIVATFIWIQRKVWRAFRVSGLYGKISKYFSIAIVTVMIHSFVDYSLRTIGVMTLLVFCLCVLVLFSTQDRDLENHY